MNPKSLFVSTAIPYVNAAPHLGFALEVVLADALARHARSRGAEVHFVSGTDDNSLKNVRAAEAAGVATRDLVDANAATFRALGAALDASYDDFVRTSADPRHLSAVRAVWHACARRGDLEKRPYEGRYCVGCERFIDASELEGGACPEHGTVPELVKEENWFFCLSRYERAIADALSSGRLRVEPPERAREVTRFLEGGLEDVSVSRSRARARGWGIPVPGDPDQVVYVWFDALVNYIASAGWPDDAPRVQRLWSAGDARRVHAVGKGIARFHAVLWPAILFAVGLPLPTTVWAHGYVTVGGQKIGKSRGNGVDPFAVAERHGSEALRYFLLRHVGPAQDADFDLARFDAVHDAELADDLGNLVSRTVALLARVAGGRIPDAPEPGVDEPGSVLLARARELPVAIDAALAGLATDGALRAIWDVVRAANKHISDAAPWALAKRAEDHPRALAVLFHVASAIAIVGLELAPFLPRTSAAIGRALASPGDRAPPLFPKLGVRKSSGPRRR
jgi:methionyl-tRNA synthetase